MTRPVIQRGAKILREKTKEISDFKSAELKELIRDLKDTLIQQEGLGIAAPQIGDNRKVFVIPEDQAPEVKTLKRPFSFIRPLRPTVFINPKIISHSEKTIIEHEGCLSIRDKFYPTKRYEEATIRAQNETGMLFTAKGADLLARIFQHETDHLNGILFVDKVYEQLSK